MGYDDVMGRVASAAAASGRKPEDITLVAVSKTMSPERVMEVYDLGHRDFGENRADEMAQKARALPKDIRWHFIGGLQSRKARLVRPVTHLLHSMDRRSLASAWLKGLGAAPPVLLQVNVGDEEQKSGVAWEEVEGSLAWMTEMGLDVQGLMAIPPVPERPEDSAPHFASLREMRDRLRVSHPGLAHLSMGMTDDFEVAIAEGASIIRVGRAIFGPRDSTGV